MSKKQADPIKQERQQLLREITEDCGDDWPEEFKPGSAGCHELLDRTLLVADLLEKYVQSHPACVQRVETVRDSLRRPVLSLSKRWRLLEHLSDHLQVVYQLLIPRRTGCTGP